VTVRAAKVHPARGRFHGAGLDSLSRMAGRAKADIPGPRVAPIHRCVTGGRHGTVGDFGRRWLAAAPATRCGSDRPDPLGVVQRHARGAFLDPSDPHSEAVGNPFRNLTRNLFRVLYRTLPMT